jgi:hypothetical protein
MDGANYIICDCSATDIAKSEVCTMDPRAIYTRLAGSFRAVFPSRSPAVEDYGRGWLKGEIRSVCAQLEQADLVFNNVTEPELIDAAIFTMRACERRLGYLFKQAKALSLAESCHNEAETKSQSHF